MLDFPRWKVWSITLTILVTVFLAVPSLLPGQFKSQWPSWLPSQTISLGLDLAGGSQLLLEADAGDAAKQRLQAMEDTVTTELRRSPRIDIGDISTAGGRLSFMVRDPTQVDSAVERLAPLRSRSVSPGPATGMSRSSIRRGSSSPRRRRARPRLCATR